MKKIALIITLLVCQTISGQQISQSNNRYRGSDVLEKKQIVVKGFGLNDAKGGGAHSINIKSVGNIRDEKGGIVYNAIFNYYKIYKQLIN